MPFLVFLLGFEYFVIQSNKQRAKNNKETSPKSCEKDCDIHIVLFND